MGSSCGFQIQAGRSGTGATVGYTPMVHECLLESYRRQDLCWSTERDRGRMGCTHATRRDTIGLGWALASRTSAQACAHLADAPREWACKLRSCYAQQPTFSMVRICATKSSGSFDNVRLWDIEATESAGVPFKIVAGHHGGTISKMGMYSCINHSGGSLFSISAD